MEKTIREWLETIEDKEVREKAIANLKRDCEQNDFEKRNSLSYAIHGAFTWVDAPEGPEYWLNIHEAQYAREQQSQYSVAVPVEKEPEPASQLEALKKEAETLSAEDERLKIELKNITEALKKERDELKIDNLNMASGIAVYVKENQKARELLKEAALQIEYLQADYAPTGARKAVLANINSFLSKY